MKPINEMNCEDIADYLHEPEPVLTAISRRLRELHEQYRWIKFDPHDESTSPRVEGRDYPIWDGYNWYMATWNGRVFMNNKRPINVAKYIEITVPEDKP